MGRGPAWTEAEMALLKENKFLSDEVLAEKLGRSVSAVHNAKHKLRHSAPGHFSEWYVPDTPLRRRPPGVYVEIIGRVLVEDEVCMGVWMRAHGYSTFNVMFEDPLGWTTLTCLKEK